MDSNWSNSEGGDGRKPSNPKASKKRKSATNEEMKSPPKKGRLIKEDEHQNKTIFDLPDELLVKIISMINIGQWPSLESICRRFRDVMNISWSQIRELRLDEFRFLKEDSFDGKTRIMNMAISKFALRSPNITSIGGLDTKDYTSLHRSWFKSLSEFENLAQIDFGRNKFCRTNLEVFLELAACRQHLKLLDVSKVYFSCSIQHDQEVNHPLIQLDTFIGFGNILNIAMRYFDAAFLKTLILKNQWGDEVKQISSIIRQCCRLEKLEFAVPRWEQRVWAMPIFESVASLENLTSLKMDDIVHHKYLHAMKDLIRSLGQRRRLSSITLSCNDEIIMEIAQNLSFLKSVDLGISNCMSSASLIKMVTRLKLLERLHFRTGLCDTNVDSRVMRAIVTNLPGLKSLHIESPKCESKNFDGLVALPLKELHIKGANLETPTIKLWAKSGLGSRLESLELTNWRGGLKRKVLAKLIMKSPRLRRLHLSNVTDRVATATVTSCPLLTDLALTESKKLSLKAVQSIIDNCGNLKFLRFESLKDWDQCALNYGKYRRVKTSWNHWLSDSDDSDSDLD